jgi:adenylate kinase
MIVILLGPPGVGKGTQAVELADGLGWRHLSTGDLLRAHRREGTALGDEAQSYMDRGELVPDDVILGMVREEMAGMDEGAGVIFDGFPRTVPQAEGLDILLEAMARGVDAVVVLEADDDVLVQRLSGRRSCPDCGAVFNVHFNPPEREATCDRCGASLVHRKDDQATTVRNRLEVYRRQTEPLIRFYEGHTAPVRRVDGELAVDAVARRLRDAVSEAGAEA